MKLTIYPRSSNIHNPIEGTSLDMKTPADPLASKKIQLDAVFDIARMLIETTDVQAITVSDFDEGGVM